MISSTLLERLNQWQLAYAALILFGSRQALGKFLPQAEIIFEYRSTETTGPAQQRLEFRQGFFGIYDALWNAINLRNDLQHFQDGLFIWDIRTFSEEAIRERRRKGNRERFGEMKNYGLFLINTTDIVSGGAWGRRPHTFSEPTLLVNKFEKNCFNPYPARRRTLSEVLPLYKATDQGRG